MLVQRQRQRWPSIETVSSVGQLALVKGIRIFRWLGFNLKVSGSNAGPDNRG